MKATYWRVLAATALTVSSALFVFATPEARDAVGQSAATTFAQKLQKVLPEFDARGRPMAEVAVRLAFEYKLPMAIEHVDKNAMRRPIQLKFKGLTVRELLSRIVAATPGYQIDFGRGLVDIYSPAARNDPSSPFNMVIPSYNAENLDTHLADAWLLCDIAQVVHGHSGCGGSVAGGQWGPVRVTLHLHDERVYQILNAIVAQNGDAVWAPVREPSGLGVDTNFWYIYPLDGPFESSVMAGMGALLSAAKPRTH